MQVLLCRCISDHLKRKEFGLKSKMVLARHPQLETPNSTKVISLPSSGKELVSEVWAPPGSEGGGAGLAKDPKG